MPQMGAVRAGSKHNPQSGSTHLPGAGPLHQELSAMLRQGRHRQVLVQCEQWLDSHPSDTQIWALAAQAADVGKEYGVAAKCAARLVELAPSSHPYWSQLARALCLSGQVGRAISAMGEAVRLAPDEPGYAGQLAELFLQDDLWADAAQAFDLATQLFPEDHMAFAGLARAQHHLGAFVPALKAIDRALHLRPEHASYHDLRGQCLRALWRPDEARQALRQALTIKPDFARGYMHYAHSFGLAAAPDLKSAAEAQLQAGARGLDAVYLGFALGEAHISEGDFAGAHDYLLQANWRHKKILGYNMDHTAALFASIRRQFDRPLGLPRTGEMPHIPVFILGLPRSGSSLLETILSCHSDVWAGGEMNHLARAVEVTGGAAAPLTAARAQELRDQYFARVPNPTGARMVTDKLPLNFRLLGHLAEAMPKARIVHVHRAARATGWSMFRNFLAGPANGFSCDPDDICRFFHLYSDLMGFWQDRYGDRIIHIRHEDLVKDPQAVISGLLQALGLAWQDACLSPQNARYQPRTASANQVARAVVHRKTQEWQAYMPFAHQWLTRLPEV